ncbi:sulfate adenylyltransferase subunit 1 [Hymenobacter gelipurpurascens]|uniref:sulfate adenylyltransferase n=1 Tax=Hymenobacter gelipurpurascens TaxID=89968 RepID=A0A212TIG1_9BACT|nr:GTP-binding protein [Hymenobacter gelipurpurascens]SNC65611.1 sulfate adenylyltransferase subunit 1 [Hymenobacter gelipurpurascens]
MDLLRFITCGSVDDGKSTLIGRLLYDSESVSLDVLAALEKRQASNGVVDLALLTDGLRAEREQGITIDVAYKYFTTPRRKFIITDAPGHVQYTRNMVTGASNADLAIVLVDARQGVIEQTRRHTLIAALLGIRQFVLAVNKMDLVDYEEAIFAKIATDYAELTNHFNLPAAVAIPLSALQGDNVVTPSTHLPWYTGPSLLEHLESVPGTLERSSEPRFQVQYVIRPQTAELPDYRGYAGQIQSGAYRRGDRVLILPSGLESEIEALEVSQREVEVAAAPQAVVIRLRDDVDVSRGDTIVPVGHQPTVTRELEATLCWMSEQPLWPGRKLLVQQHSALVKAAIPAILYKVNVQTFARVATDSAQLNDIVRVRIKTALPLALDHYQDNRVSGSFILVDELSGDTVAAGLVEAANSEYFTAPVPPPVVFSI